MLESLNRVFDRIREIQGKLQGLYVHEQTVREKPAVSFSKKLEESIERLDSDIVDIKPANSLQTEKYGNFIQKASEQYELPEELIKAVIKQESNFNPLAVSPKGAMGLMQIMPATAKELNVSDAFNPENNIMAGSGYLKSMLARFNNNLVKALAAYNAGPEKVEGNQFPDYPETRNYVEKVIGNYMKFSSGSKL
ncbi:MAG TPA: lytic murein transglycosylase [Spirochaetia bacterium]|nr:lytic murein transglycosylase [Spirochaetia bacterium]